MTATPTHQRRTVRIAATTVITAAALTATVLATGPTAEAATVGTARTVTGHHQVGRIATAWQSTVDHHVHVTGYAYDSGAGQHHRSVRVSVYVNGRRRSLTADRPSPHYDHRRDIHGRHRFSAVLDTAHHARRVRLVVHSAGQHNGAAVTDIRGLAHPAGRSIVRVARRYLGSRYSYGADGPHAFDCSGYSRFVYRKARVARLPHNSQAQRHARHMHAISRRQARPGDLVFYLSGNSAYHVSIFAGHDMQYSATDPARGVEHSRISSRHVIFESDWH